MEEEINMQKTKELINTLVKMVETYGWEYVKGENYFNIYFADAEDDSLIYEIHVDTESKRISVTAVMPFSMPKDKYLEGALAICIANSTVIEGFFTLYVSGPFRGEINFKSVYSYRGCTLSEAWIECVVANATYYVRGLKEKFYKLSTGEMTLDQFIEQL